MDSSSIFKPYRDYHNVRGDKQMMIKNSIGRQLPYIVNFQKSTCQIFDIELERITHAFVFPDSCVLVDADYFPTQDGKFGIIIGVEDREAVWGCTNFVLGLAINPDAPTMTVTHSVEVPEKVTVVKTLYSNDNMSDGQSLGLYPKLLQWQHIIAIGCKQSKCFLTQLPRVNNGGTGEVAPTIHNTPKKGILDLMACYVDNDIFTYTLEDGAFREYPAQGVYVSSLALMPRSRTLLVGLSMGGIIAASLNPSNQMSMLELRHERLIHALAPLEPEDDPDKFEYFIAAVDRSSRHPIMLQMWRGAFAKDKVPDEQKYDCPSYSVCLEHKILNAERWLSVKTIVQERSVDGGLRRRNDSSMDSMLLNSSQMFGCTFNRSNVFLAYERRQSQDLVVEAAIFDIDAWYYKRVPGRMLFDGTYLRQSPFMSCIKSDIESRDVTDIGILTLDSTNMYRFNSMISDADQLFYPSAVSYERVFVASTRSICWMKIQNLQETILQKAASKLPFIVRSADPMATNIIAAGLVRKNILTGSPNSSATEPVEEDPKLSMSLRVVLNSMVYYGKIEEFCGLITRNELSDKIKVEIAEWAFLEAVEYKRIIADRIVSLLQGSTSALSPLAEDTLQQGIKMFRIVHEYLRGCSKSLSDSTLKSYAMSVKCMLNHTKLVHQFVNSRIVPVNYSIEIVMRQQHEKRKGQALRNRTALPVQTTTRNMHRLAPNAQFWNQLPHDEWYPPTPLDLLESLLNVSITERLKRDIIVQYVLDWIRSNPDSDFSDNQLAMEVIKVMTIQMLGVDLEKIYHILEQEKDALTRPATVVEEENSGSTAKKVFSLEEDGLTYEQLWSGKVHLGWTIKPADLEKFKLRMKAQEEDVEGTMKRKLFDSDTEKFYQAFLFDNQKYHLMSKEAIESNKLLTSLFPKLLQEQGKMHSKFATKTAKEKEIERSVKEMFEKQYKRDMEGMPEVYAKMGEDGGNGGRKRKSEVFEEPSEKETSPMSFVPPTAKRIQSRLPSTASPIVEDEPEDIHQQKENQDLNKLIATPARYYKRPIPAQELTSPTHLQKAPPVPQQNSILKTAKALQSPGRGRIRFHASVRKCESFDEDPEDPEDVVEQDPENPKKINFAILEDEDEEEPTYLRRSRSNSKAAETSTPEFEVLEDQIEETTFEIQDEDNFKTLDENATYEEESQQTEKIQMESAPGSLDTELKDTEPTDDFAEPEWDGIERSFEKQSDEDCDVVMDQTEPVFAVPSLPRQVEKVQEAPEPIPQAPETLAPVYPDLAHDVETEAPENQNLEKLALKLAQNAPETSDPALPRSMETRDSESSDPPKISENVPKSIQDAPETSDQPLHVETQASELSDAPSTAQNAPRYEDSDAAESQDVTLPILLPNRIHLESEDPSEDVPLDRTFEVQEEEEDEPMPRGDAEPEVEPEEAPKEKRGQKKTPAAESLEETMDMDGPPSANTRSRSRTGSRSVTPVELDSTISIPKTRKPRHVETTSEVQDEDEEHVETVRPKSRTRAPRGTVSRDVETEEVEPPKRPTSRTRKAVQKIEEDVEAAAKKSATSRGNPVVDTPRPGSRARRAPKEPLTSTRARSRSRVASENAEAPPAAAEPTPRVTRGKASSRATTPARQADDVANTTKTTTRGKKVERPVTPNGAADEEMLNETGASVKRRLSTRTLARATSVQPESSRTPASTASTKRSNTNTVVSAPTTPRRGRPPKSASESDANVMPVVPTSSAARGSTKRRNTPEEPDTPRDSSSTTEPVKKAPKASRSRTTSLKSIPEVEPVAGVTPKLRRSRTASSTSNSVPTSPKRGKKQQESALEVVEEEEPGVEEEEVEEPPVSVRRSARRLQQQQRK